MAMVRDQSKARGVRDSAVLEVLQSVPRHCFIPGGVRCSAYVDSPLPIGFDQTIPQPYVVARMTKLLGVQEHNRVLAIGTGSGHEGCRSGSALRPRLECGIRPGTCQQGRSTLSGASAMAASASIPGMATREGSSTLRSFAP